MFKNILMCAITIVSLTFASNIDVLKKIGMTDIKTIYSVPTFLQMPLISVGMVPGDGGETIVNPKGERIGKLGEDYLAIGEDNYPIVEEYFGTMNGKPTVVIYTSAQIVIIQDIPAKSQGDVGARYMFQFISRTNAKSFKMFIR